MENGMTVYEPALEDCHSQIVECSEQNVRNSTLCFVHALIDADISGP